MSLTLLGEGQAKALLLQTPGPQHMICSLKVLQFLLSGVVPTFSLVVKNLDNGQKRGKKTEGSQALYSTDSTRGQGLKYRVAMKLAGSWEALTILFTQMLVFLKRLHNSSVFFKTLLLLMHVHV